MDRLGVATEELNLEIREVEKALEGLGLGVTAMVEGQYSMGILRLRFGKMEKEWRLMFEFQDGTVIPLSNASRAVRVAAMEYLGVLHAALHEENRREEGEVRAAIAKARAFRESLERAKEVEKKQEAPTEPPFNPF